MSSSQNPDSHDAPVALSNEIITSKVINHPLTEFDETHFVDLLEHSLSLSTFEKKRVVDNIPQLSQFQIDELIKVFEEERVEFRKLVPTEWEVIKWLVSKAQTEWQQLKEIYSEEARSASQAELDKERAEEIKKNLGL